MNSYITIDGWKTGIRFSSAHIIPEYEKCGRIHGHTYAVHLKIAGKMDEKGIIMDFSIVKDVLRNVVDVLDHHILIPLESKAVKIEEKDDYLYISMLKKKYVLPKNDCLVLPIESTSAENLAKYILKRLTEDVDFPDRVNSVEVGVDEGYGQGARISKNF